VIRDLKRADADRVFEFLSKYFPEEEAILGTRPDGFEKVVRRIFRLDTRFVLGLLRLFGRPVFRFFVVEEGGQVVATTLLSFPPQTGYLSMVVVDPQHRRRGYAQALLEKCRVTSQAVGKKYVALDVLSNNTPARALYERVGYRPLQENGFLVREADAPLTGAPSPAIRAYQPKDAAALVEIARRTQTEESQKVVPYRASLFKPGGFVNSLMQTESAAWVIDRGHGAEGYLQASAGRITEAGHFSTPFVAEGVEAPEAAALVRIAIEWCVARGAPRIVSMVPGGNLRGRAALLGGGFHEALSTFTLYRTVA
jgi:ribosomal protein S18 acetylase RimI-like enzyme